MLVSIVHRVTGSGLAVVGVPLLLWWLAALAGGEASYAEFRGVFTAAGGKLNAIGLIVGVGLTLALFQHLASGVRHLFMDEGALFELKRNALTANLTMVASVAATAIFWWMVWGKIHG